MTDNFSGYDCSIPPDILEMFKKKNGHFQSHLVNKSIRQKKIDAREIEIDAWAQEELERVKKRFEE